MASAGQSEERSPRQPHVLCVHHDPGELGLIQSALAGHVRLSTSTSAPDALVALAAQHFDLVLADVKVAEASAWSFLENVRGRQPNARRVVLGTAADAPLLVRAINAGLIHRFLELPLKAEELLACARSLTAGLQEHGMCVVLGPETPEIEAARQDLKKLSGLRMKCAARLELGPEVSLVVVNASTTTTAAVETLITQLGGHQREVALFVAVDPRATNGAAMYLRAGADDVLWNPLNAEELLLRFRMWRSKRALARESNRLRVEVLSSQQFAGIVGASEPLREVLRMVERVAGTDATVLVTGETGTGKELISRAIHAASQRRDGPFVAVNLAAVPETLVESEIFGHEAGAFTGAKEARRGRLEIAEGGTLFLDEVGDLSMGVQVKLLRVLQDGKFERVGETRPRQANFRLVCATHRDLEERVREGKFREDLYYRLDVIRMHLPPLRERQQDIEMLASHFVEFYATKTRRRDLHLTSAAMAALKAHGWPGNIRELQHTIERAVVLCDRGTAIDAELVQPRPARARVASIAHDALREARGLDVVLADMERIILSETMERFAGNQTAVADHLKLNRQTLRYRLRKSGLL